METAEREERDRREDLSALLELRDIVDELGTIMKLFDQQKGAIRTMLKYYDSKGDGKNFLTTALRRIHDHSGQVSEMMSNSISAQKAVCNYASLLISSCEIMQC